MIAIIFLLSIAFSSQTKEFYEIWDGDQFVTCAKPNIVSAYKIAGYQAEKHLQENEGSDFWFETVMADKKCKKIILDN